VEFGTGGILKFHLGQNSSTAEQKRYNRVQKHEENAAKNRPAGFATKEQERGDQATNHADNAAQNKKSGWRLALMLKRGKHGKKYYGWKKSQRERQCGGFFLFTRFIWADLI
jgi:hypothetical protein